MQGPVQITALLVLQAALLAIVGGVAWGCRRVAAGEDRWLDRIEARLAALEAAVRRIEPAPAAPRSVEAARPADDRRDRSPRPTPPRRTPGRPPGPAGEGPGPTLIAVPDLSGPSRTVGSQAEAARRAAASGDLARRFGRVWAMADEGASADRIASATGQPIGQVELVLNLRRRLLEGLDDDHDRDRDRDARAGGVPA